jgi:hypothetical protein
VLLVNQVTRKVRCSEDSGLGPEAEVLGVKLERKNLDYFARQIAGYLYKKVRSDRHCFHSLGELEMEPYTALA